MGNPDLSQPVSVLLRHGTKQAHEQAEHSPGAGWLTRGELDRDEYVRFLMMLYTVYSTLEGALDAHHAHPVLKPTYNPSVLARAEPIAQDIAYFLGTDAHTWKEHSAYLSFTSNMPPQVSAYAHHLQELSSSPKSSTGAGIGLLLAHAYVRYLGDLSGGQFIRRRIAKVYDLPSTGAGVKFYTFATSAGEGEAGMKEMKDLKDWYRDGMDSGVGEDDHHLKAALVDEAILAFKLNQDLFAALRAPSHSILPPTSPMITQPPTPTTLFPPKLVPRADSPDKSKANTSNALTILIVLLISTVSFLVYNNSSMILNTRNA